MVKITDVLIELLLVLSFFICTAVIMAGTDYPYLFFVPLLLFVILHVALKRKKRIGKYLKEDFRKMGYEVISERPLKFSEVALEIKPAILINDIPASRYSYIRKFARIFEVKTETNEVFEINTEVTKRWNGKNSIEIKKKKRKV